MNNILENIINKKEEQLIHTGIVSSLSPLAIKFYPGDDAINVTCLSNLLGIKIGSNVLLVKYQSKFIIIGAIQDSPYPIGWTIYERKDSDTDRTSTTASNDPHLSISLPPYGIYECEAEFILDGDDNDTDLKLSWDNSNVNELTRRQITGIGTSSTSTANAETFYSNNYGFVTESQTGVTAGGWTIRREHFIISTDGTTGIITPTWGCVNSSGTVTLKAFSFIIARKIDNN